jgi:hypothetical protein
LVEVVLKESSHSAFENPSFETKIRLFIPSQQTTDNAARLKDFKFNRATLQRFT